MLIINCDDKPVPVRRAILETIEWRLKFLPDAAGDHLPYLVKPAAGRRDYDLAAILGMVRVIVRFLINARQACPSPES